MVQGSQQSSAKSSRASTEDLNLSTFGYPAPSQSSSEESSFVFLSAEAYTPPSNPKTSLSAGSSCPTVAHQLEEEATKPTLTFEQKAHLDRIRAGTAQYRQRGLDVGDRATKLLEIDLEARHIVERNVAYKQTRRSRVSRIRRLPERTSSGTPRLPSSYLLLEEKPPCPRCAAMEGEPCRCGKGSRERLQRNELGPRGRLRLHELKLRYEVGEQRSVSSNGSDDGLVTDPNRYVEVDRY